MCSEEKTVATPLWSPKCPECGADGRSVRKIASGGKNACTACGYRWGPNHAE